MKKYIILGFLYGMGGGHIYTQNKVDYLERHGWQVSVFCAADDQQQIFLDGLKKFKGNRFQEMSYPPSFYSKYTVNNVLNVISEKIHYSPENEIIIESGSRSLALWGEVLAQKFHCKNFTFLLDGFFQPDKISDDEKNFYVFKLKRGELACTTVERTMDLFSDYKPADKLPRPALRATCRNSVYDIENSPVLDKLMELPHVDLTIGHIGRADKPYVLEFLDVCFAFANQHRDKKIRVLMLGGRQSEENNLLQDKIAKCGNCEIYYTGFLFPIPKKIFTYMDVCVGSSGSARAVPLDIVSTILVKDDDIRPFGVLGFDGLSANDSPRHVTQKSLTVLLEDILINKKYKPQNLEIANKAYNIDEAFDAHMKMIQESSQVMDFYNVRKINFTRRQNLLRNSYRILGQKITKKLVKYVTTQKEK